MEIGPGNIIDTMIQQPRRSFEVFFASDVNVKRTPTAPEKVISITGREKPKSANQN